MPLPADPSAFLLARESALPAITSIASAGTLSAGGAAILGRSESLFVGVDVSKDRLDVHVRPGGEAFAVSRDGNGLGQLVERLQALSPTLVAVEATGGFETIVAAAIAGAELPLAVVNPAQIRHFAQAVGKRAKTDPIDAGVIAHFAEAVRPASRALPDEASRLLDAIRPLSADLFLKTRLYLRLYARDQDQIDAAFDACVKCGIPMRRRNPR